MKRAISAILCVMLVFSAFSAFTAVNAADENTQASIGFSTYEALYAHATAGSPDTQAWQAWQSRHDEDFNVQEESVKYFFLPSSANESEVEIYNAYPSSVTVNGVAIPSKEAKTVSYTVNSTSKVTTAGKTYTLKFMKSNAEAAIYVNNSNADGYGTELMQYLNDDKSRSAKAEGAIVTPDGSIDNTAIKKIKGRGNTTWGKPKKAYNITYDSNVKIAGMSKSKKYSLLANYQDDSLSRNRFLYDLSDAVGMPYASDSRYVDFYANGYYWGSFQICEKIEAGKNNLVNDVDDTAYLNADGTVNADFPFVCEVDAGANDDDYFVRTNSGNNITIKAPELEQGDAGYEEVKQYVKSKFDALFNAAKQSDSDLSSYADVASVTKLYLINELGKNWDSGVSSMYFVYKQDENGEYKFYGSPVWDYDNSLGNANGVEWELSNIGVKDYTEYSGWWCKYKGKGRNDRNTTNIMNLLSKHSAVLQAAPKIWFEEFVPAINRFNSNKTDFENSELYTRAEYYSLVKDSAEMNYTSGWLLKTSDWISDHSSLKRASFNEETKTYTVESKSTSYADSFEGMFNFCADWLTSRAAWLSSQMAADYTPPAIIKGDADQNKRIDISDVTAIQKHCASIAVLSDNGKKAADVNNDGTIDIRDVTIIQKHLAGLIKEL